jgi:CubicO group peptidase (beta-lactamase class C family)
MLGFLFAGCAPDREPLPSPADADAAAQAPYPTGLAANHMQRARERADTLPNLQALLVARHGTVELAQRVNGPSLDTPVNVKSVSKSILSALVGIAIEEGHLEGVDQRIAPFFEQYLSEDSDPRKRDITIGHLLSMRSGLQRTSGSNYGAWVSSSNWVRNAIQRPMQSAPGTERRYSTGNSHLLSAVLTQATGQSTWAFAREHLAGPLGVTLPRWTADPQGIYLGGNDMRISARGLLAFGEMYRNGGWYNGTRVVPQDWVRASWVRRSRSRWSGAGYGYSWFTRRERGHRMHYGWGYGGQYVFIVPTLELTVVATSKPYASGGREHRRRLQAIVSEEIIPAAEQGAKESQESTEG